MILTQHDTEEVADRENIEDRSRMNKCPFQRKNSYFKCFVDLVKESGDNQDGQVKGEKHSPSNRDRFLLPS